MRDQNIIEPELRDIKLYKAKDSVLDGIQTEQLQHFFKECGNQFILSRIKKALEKEELQLVFFEHSYFATAIIDNKNAVFVCIWKKDELTEKQVNKFQYFFTLLDRQFETAYPILWDPDFFIDPQFPHF